MILLFKVFLSKIVCLGHLGKGFAPLKSPCQRGLAVKFTQIHDSTDALMPLLLFEKDNARLIDWHLEIGSRKYYHNLTHSPSTLTVEISEKETYPLPLTSIPSHRARLSSYFNEKVSEVLSSIKLFYFCDLLSEPAPWSYGMAALQSPGPSKLSPFWIGIQIFYCSV